MVATSENYSTAYIGDYTYGIEIDCVINSTPYLDLYKDFEKFFKDVERELKRDLILHGIRYKSNEFKLDRKKIHKHKAPKVVNRKLSKYSCIMRGRNKPCRRVAIVNQE